MYEDASKEISDFVSILLDKLDPIDSDINGNIIIEGKFEIIMTGYFG